MERDGVSHSVADKQKTSSRQSIHDPGPGVLQNHGPPSVHTCHYVRRTRTGDTVGPPSVLPRTNPEGRLARAVVGPSHTYETARPPCCTNFSHNRRIHIPPVALEAAIEISPNPGGRPTDGPTDRKTVVPSGFGPRRRPGLPSRARDPQVAPPPIPTAPGRGPLINSIARFHLDGLGPHRLIPRCLAKRRR